MESWIIGYIKVRVNAYKTNRWGSLLEFKTMRINWDFKLNRKF